MFKKTIVALTAFTLVAPICTTVSATELKYASNAFTQVTNTSQKVENVQTLEGFEKVAENETLTLYVEQKGLAIKIQDKRSNYIWSSTAPNMDGERLNNKWKNFINSALTIEYVDRKEKVKTENILDRQSRVKMKKTKTGFEATVEFKESRIEMKLVVSLTEDGLKIHVPKESIREKGKNRLTTVQVYPFLGATKQDTISGYMFVPDGTGALIRYKNTPIGGATPYEATVYGTDKGFNRESKHEGYINDPEQIHFPVYGIVHGEKQNALMTTIEEGEHYAKVAAYPSGVSTDFNWINSTFQYRYQYFQPTSKNMKGVNKYQEALNDFDITLQVKLLTKEDADYVGMAKAYQADLVEKGVLTKNDNEHVRMRVEFLGAERKEGLFRDSVIPMTTIEDMNNIINDLQKEDINHLEAVYRGWNKDGFSGSFPNKLKVERELGSKKELEEVAEELQKENISFSLYTDYLRGDKDYKGFSGSKDVAKKISVEPIEKMKNGYEYYYLSPGKSKELFEKSEDFFADVNVKGIAMDTVGSTLFSDFNKSALQTRTEAQETYEKIGEKAAKDFNHVATYKPNEYMLPYSDVIYDVPMHSSKYQAFTDTVPFIPMVLKGYIDYYAPFSNFLADTDDILKMVEYGAFPSFYLTKEQTFELQHTGSKDLYTARYETWKEEMIDQYNLVQTYLAPVQGEEMVGRTMLASGVVKVDYSNNTSLIINYTEKDYNGNGYEVPANNIISVKGA